jgi:ribosome-interacting GTPase 1
MPVNAPAEYFKAEQKFQSAKTIEEKIIALEEMIRLLPKHHGSEQMHAQLKSKLAKLKKEQGKTKGGAKKTGVKKEGEAQVCVIGTPNSGKSTLLRNLTDAKPAVSTYPYTTIEPAVGMMDYRGVQIQLVEIPSTLEPRFLSIVRSAELVLVLVREKTDKKGLADFLEDNFIRTKRIYIDYDEDVHSVKEKIWRSLEMMIVYTKDKGKISPMALPLGAKVKDFAQRVHKDFIKHFNFARLERKDAKGVNRGHVRQMQVGLTYELKDGDIVEIHTK